MDALLVVGSAMGLSFVAGMRLYATVLTLGLAIRLGWLQLDPAWQSLDVFANPLVLAAAAAAYIAEFFADKIPWVDTAWDFFHTFIRPLATAALAAAALGPIDPVLKVLLVILCGGVALASTTSKAATRLVVNHAPVPGTTLGLSLLGDLFAPFGVWLSLSHPYVVLGCVLVFLALFAIIMPRIVRALRLQAHAVRALFRAMTGSRASMPPASALARPDLHEVLQAVAARSTAIPETHAAHLTGPQFEAPVMGLRTAATRSISGLHNCVGYLAIGREDIAFVTRRLFRYRVHRIALADITGVEWRKGLLLNRLVLNTRGGARVFHTFKDVRVHKVTAPAPKIAPATAIAPVAAVAGVTGLAAVAAIPAKAPEIAISFSKRQAT